LLIGHRLRQPRRSKSQPHAQNIWLEGWRSTLRACRGIYALRPDARDVPPHPDLEWIAITKDGDDLHALACRGGSVLLDLAGGPVAWTLATVTHGLILVRTT
jgi:hypothetical protein